MTNRLRLAEFALDDDTVYLRGFHDPADLWNGWNKVYCTRGQLEDYCKRSKWVKCAFSRDTAIIKFWVGAESSGYWEYDEFPMRLCNTFRIGRTNLYALDGWCWLEKSRL